jgi:hypothetical protein
MALADCDKCGLPRNGIEEMLKIGALHWDNIQFEFEIVLHSSQQPAIPVGLFFKNFGYLLVKAFGRSTT